MIPILVCLAILLLSLCWVVRAQVLLDRAKRVRESTARREASAIKERLEAAWLLSQAHRISRPKRPAYEDVVDFGQTMRG